MALSHDDTDSTINIVIDIIIILRQTSDLVIVL